MEFKGVVFYHPKNPRNVSDMLALVKSVGGRLVVVPREGEQLELPADNALEPSSTLYEAVSSLGGSQAIVLVLETYGVDVDELRSCVSGTTAAVVVVVGAEDYGVPLEEVETLRARGVPVCVIRLPARAVGHSYNVVASLAMLLYELKRIGILKR